MIKDHHINVIRNGFQDIDRKLRFFEELDDFLDGSFTISSVARYLEGVLRQLDVLRDYIDLRLEDAKGDD